MSYNWDNDYTFRQNFNTLWLFLNILNNGNSFPSGSNGFHALVFASAMNNMANWYINNNLNAENLTNSPNCANFYTYVLTAPIPGLTSPNNTFLALDLSTTGYTGSVLEHLQTLLSSSYASGTIPNAINSLAYNYPLNHACYKDSCINNSNAQALWTDFWNLFYSMYQYDTNVGSINNVATAITNFIKHPFTDGYLNTLSIYMNTSSIVPGKTMIDFVKENDMTHLAQVFAAYTRVTWPLLSKTCSYFTALLARVAYEEYWWPNYLSSSINGWSQGFVANAATLSATPPLLSSFTWNNEIPYGKLTCYATCTNPSTEDFWECQ